MWCHPFPNLSDQRTAGIERYKAEKNELKVECLDHQQVALYISINRDKTRDLARIERHPGEKHLNEDHKVGYKHKTSRKEDYGCRMLENGVQIP